MKPALLAAALAACLAPTQIVVGQSGPPAPGMPAPVVTVRDLDGQPVDLGEWIGKQPVLIQFWATWCQQCKALLPRLRAASERYQDVAFIGINVAVAETPDRVRQYLDQHAPPFRVLYDTEGVSQRAYEVPTTSYMVVIDAAGRVVHTGYGPAQRFEDALARVAGERP